MEGDLSFVPSRPAPFPPKRDSLAPTTPTYDFLKMAASHTDNNQGATSSSSSESGEKRPRRSSLSFISRTKSHKVPIVRSPSGRKMLRKQRVRDQEERLRQEQVLPNIGNTAPQLPHISSLSGDMRPDSIAIVSGKAHDYSHSANFSRPKKNTPSPVNFSIPNVYGVPLPPMPLRSSPSLPAGSLPRTESIVSRGRESYAPSISASMQSPRRMRRRKDPEAFNILVAGAKGSGKTSFVEFLKKSLALPPSKQTRGSTPPEEGFASESPFTPSYLETELDGERVGLTLWDSAGLEKSVVDLQLREMTAFIESKFEDTFNQESRVVRTPGVKDTHIHCVLLLLDPVRLSANAAAVKECSLRKPADLATGVLDEALDLQSMRALEGKATVIPVIAKADTLTTSHMAFLKRCVWSSIQRAKLDPLEALSLEDDESWDSEAMESEMSSSESELHSNQSSPPHKVTQNLDRDDSDAIGTSPSPTNTKNQNTPSSPARLANDATSTATEEFYIPFSILSPDPYSMPGSLTRKFPWGEADPMDSAHCDYIRLRDSIFSEWRADLRLASREKWYEAWRTSRLKRAPQPRIRQAGGVTPVGVVPREGRTVSPTMNLRAASASRQTSRRYDESYPEKPRTMSSTSKAERILGSPRGIAL